ncbi:topless-related protein 4 [Artemisia annua]|uniref:Topless-related protein 4 n=1 Tax=Artemisia annua TaxID=35608 RepID=A0A2U1NCF5_ARTAN|nr:topless-related protein 4 [Artemisia annua]
MDAQRMMSTKNDVQLSEDFKLGQLSVWIAKEPRGIRVPLHAGKSLNQHNPSMPLSVASTGPVNLTIVMGSHGKSSYAFADLPKEVVMTLEQGSIVTCEQILEKLRYGTSVAGISLFRKISRFPILVLVQATLANDYTASINRVTWSPDGKLFVNNVVQIYSYHGGDDIRKHLEIEAHVGSTVNDLAFSFPNNKLSIVTEQIDLEGFSCELMSVRKVWVAWFLLYKYNLQVGETKRIKDEDKSMVE